MPPSAQAAPTLHPRRPRPRPFPSQVSRRLQRRLYSELRSSGYGYVKLAVEAYSLLLRHGRPERSGLLGNELVVRTVVKRRK